HFGEQENVLAVRLTPEDHSSRWYPGAGIYRNVWLDITAPVHVARWGVYVTTRDFPGYSNVFAKTELRNRRSDQANVSLRTTILDADRKRISEKRSKLTIGASANQTVETGLPIKNPQHWDIDHPYLYTLVSDVLEGDRLIDHYETTFGVRTIAFYNGKFRMDMPRANGFFLNGRQLKIQGVCDHHDLGALGAAVNRRATERQLEILKAAGVNAIRTSHNPPSPELLDLADRMGFLVMDEAFDMWRIPKVPNGYSKYYDQWSEQDIRDMVRRDRNHPSIIMWSIGNEIPEQREADGWKEAKRLVDFVHQEDATRPTTSAFNNWDDAIKNKLADQVDLPGFNYQPMHYEQIMKDHPKWIIFGSETASCVSSRGTYHLPIEKYEKHESLQLSGYDIIAPRWAYCPDPEFAAQDKFPQVLGEFVWTGFDYIGEPTPYFDRDANSEKDWPARSSYFGMVDLAGFPKDRYYLYQSVWSKKPMVHLLPHWNWQTGQTIPVMVYSNGDEVELFLNGKSLGRKKRFSQEVELPVGPKISADGKYVTKYRLEWQVPFEPGTIRAVAYQNGKEIASDERRTAGAAAKITLLPDHNTIRADGDDLSFITVRIEDKDGNLVPMADNLVHFALTGPGEIAAVDNGNAATVEPFHADYRKAFNGLALLIVRSVAGHAAQIQVAATSDGLSEGTTQVTTQAATQQSASLQK
ncbi:MAG TPA: glycoside hydrolase family 2 TIM barrel-domain containing protein, partial [Terriglobales bacterium]